MKYILHTSFGKDYFIVYMIEKEIIYT